MVDVFIAVTLAAVALVGVVLIAASHEYEGHEEPWLEEWTEPTEEDFA